MFWNTYIPLELPEKESMSENEFFKFCAANKHLKIERDENHQILIMPPSGLDSSYQNGQVYAALNNWNLKEQKGKSFESSAGFDNIISGEDVLPGFSFDLKILRS